MTFGTFFLPGPTEVRPEVLQAMTRPMISHRGAAFQAMFARVQPALQAVFGTAHPVFIATSSATGLMEAAVRNAPAGRVLALVNGAFSSRFAHVAEACGRAVERYEVPWGAVHDPAEVSRRVTGAAVVTVVHSETSTGALNDVRAISNAAHAAGAMCVIDSVSGIRGAEMRFDAWSLDYVFTGSQKAMALPPGLAFAVASPAYLTRGDRAQRGAYFDLAEYASNAEKGEAPNTPSLPLYYALDAQRDRILGESATAAWARHAGMAALTVDWAGAHDLEILAPKGHRSPTVSTIVLPAGIKSDSIVRAVADAGYTIGSGYGKLKDTTIRIGHMGDHTPDGVARVLRITADALGRR